MDQSKCIFKVVVGVFDVERKCHGVYGTPQLSYNLSFQQIEYNALCRGFPRPKGKMSFGLLILHLKMIFSDGKEWGGGGGGAPYMLLGAMFLSRLSAAIQCLNLRIHILLAGK